MKMFYKLCQVLLIAGLSFAMPAISQAAPANGNGAASLASPDRLAVPVTGTASVPGVEGSSAFVGTYNISHFVRDANQVFAVGTLVGNVQDAASGAVRTIVRPGVRMPLVLPASGGVTTQQLACEILNLELGPLHLDLLGLVIDLNQVVLDISAVPGAGNLLGNLLCAITNLLNGAGTLAQLVALLNQLLALLG